MRIAPASTFEPIAIGRTTRVFVLTGAGISAESGIRTFRDAGGLWEEHRFEDVASPEAWARDPALVWRFYSARRRQAMDCQPNAAHAALARLGGFLGEGLSLCTQNVDDLHEKAGSTHVLHMHGELFKSRCEDTACTRLPFADHASYHSLETIPRCHCGAQIRPHIVWFGEIPFEMHTLKRAAQGCDIFVTIGSSGAVYPAAGLVREIRYREQSGETVRAIYLGPEAPDNAGGFHECRLGKAGEAVPNLFSYSDGG